VARVWGYVRKSVLPDFMTVEEQSRLIQEYAATQLAAHEFMGVTIDDLLDARIFKFLDRPNAAALNVQMQRGDHIVIARMDRGWRDMRDFVQCYELWAERGVLVHVLDFQIRTDSFDGVGKVCGLRHVADWATFVRLELTKERRAAKGFLTEPYFVRRKLGWKYKIVGWTNRGQAIRKLLPDHKERTLMREIVELIDGGWRWREVAELFKKRGLKKRFKTGKVFPWKVATIGSTYKAAKKMMEAGEL
jgi:hypothetical protein